jgi:general L-amino acid transport system permease protein
MTPAAARPEVLSTRIQRGRIWARRNLFRNWRDTILTIVIGSVSAYLTFLAVRFVFVTGRWEIIDTNLKLLMVGRFPSSELSVVAWSMVVLATWFGLIAGLVHARQVRAGTSRVVGMTRSERARDLALRFWLLLVTALLLLLLAGTAGPWLMMVGMVLGGLVGRLGGSWAGRRLESIPVGVVTLGALGLAATPLVVTLWLASVTGWNEWGGFMLNIFLAITSIILCFPLGVLLALGRRSKLPLLRVICTTYIEVFRGSPLFVLLLMAQVALEFFVPSSMAPGVAVRAIVVFTLFTAAYVAEIVRGGLQSVHAGQAEAAKAVGLSPTRTTVFIVLPQALRNVIPAQIGQFISLFKDTTLAGVAMGVFEILNVGTSITKQPEFLGQGLVIETMAFIGFLFWVGSYTMSRESQRLERRLGVGTR